METNVKMISQVSQAEVWKHWMDVEKTINPNFRSDIRDPLPTDLNWYLAEIQKSDIDSMFILSSGDWHYISGESYRVKDVVARLDLNLADRHSVRITKDIQNKIAFVESGRSLDSKLIAVTHDAALNGPFTLIEGNRRAVAFTYLGSMIGSEIYIGVSESIENYSWACKSYRP